MICQAVALLLLELTGPDHQPIEVNADEIVALRPPRVAEHFARGAKCIVSTADGHFLVVLESCPEVERRVREVK